MSLHPLLAAGACLFAALLAAPPGHAAPRKYSSDGYQYQIDKAPTWVDAVRLPLVPPGTRWQYVLRDRQIRVDDTPQVYLHAIRKIHDAAGLAEGSSIEIDFDPTYHQLTLHEIRIDRDGKALDRLDPRTVKLLRREKRLEQGSYDGVVTASIQVNDVRAGDVISYRYTLAGGNPVFGKRFASVLAMPAERAPTALLRYRLLHPAARDIRLRAPEWSRVEEVAAPTPGWKERLVSATNVPTWDLPADSPPELTVAQLIQMSEYADWPAVSAWGRSLFPDVPPDAAVKALAESLRAKAPDDAGRALAALEFVQREIRYFSVAFGESTHRPALPARVLERRFGDCKDKSYLLLALFNAMGIPARPVLASQFARGAVQGMLPSPLAFDHVVVAAEVNGETLWLDPTRDRQSGPLAGRVVLRLAAGLPLEAPAGSEIARVPRAAKSTLDAEAIDTITVDSLALPATIRSEVRFRGDFAEALREVFGRPEGAELREKQFDYLARMFGSSLVATGPVTIADQEDGIVIAREFRFDNPWAYPSERMLRFEWGPWLVGDTVQPGLDPSRRHSMDVGWVRNVAHRVRIRFSEPVMSEAARNGASYDGKYFRSRVEMVQERESIEHTTTFEYTADTVERDGLPAHAAKLRELIQASGITLLVSPVPASRSREVIEKMESAAAGRTRGIPAPETRVQATSIAEDIVFTAHLDGGRLAPKNRAAALKRRAFARDYLGKADEALADIRAAATLAPDERSIVIGLAEVHFGRGEFAEAAKVLEKYASETGAVPDLRYKRGRVRFYLGDFNGAAEDFEANARESTGAERQYALLWLQASLASKGVDPVATVRTFDRSDTVRWPYPILQHVLGETDEATLLKAARDPDASTQKSQLCEAYFFAGLKKRIAGDNDGARRLFQSARYTKVTEYTEYRTAGFELERLRGK
ncbi:hypothetical protein BWI17_06080 [Betaproteobacteria bacterium GR16-43]|nr:hypothetical protein BWI17_06080 [Betaproteobacteria bacterium GR16-43]